MSSSSRPGHDDRTLVADLRFERRAQRELHVGRGEVEPARLGPEQDRQQHLHGRACRDRTADDAEMLGELSERLIDVFNPVPTTMSDLHHSLKSPLVVVIGSVDDGEDGTEPLAEAVCAVGGRLGTNGVRCTGLLEALVESLHSAQRACLIRAVSSCTRLYTDRSSRIRRAILDVAWITVVWSRPPNSLPIFGSDESVSSRERYIATWRG